MSTVESETAAPVSELASIEHKIEVAQTKIPHQVAVRIGQLLTGDPNRVASREVISLENQKKDILASTPAVVDTYPAPPPIPDRK